MQPRVQRTLIWIISALIALLAARGVLLLMAADPLHPFVRAITWLTQPLVWPLAWLDRSQPQTGVRFERAPWLIILDLLLLSACLNYIWRRKERARG